MAARRPVPDAEGRAAVATVLTAGPAGSDRATLRLAVRWLLEELARRAPGSSVEVRVPPFAAVQAVAGPTHRRGTPSAVIEMDAATWLALATGETRWDQARAAGLVTASGTRADLAPWLPLLAGE